MYNLRYEKKFVINKLDKNQLINLLKFSSLNFIKHYSDRKVNSIYLDDNFKSSFYENIDGDNRKSKIRLRWYGDQNKISSLNLEIKKKISSLNYKSISKINIAKSIYLNKKFYKEKIYRIFKKKNFKLNFSAISSVHYLRTYFISTKIPVRATIDSNISYINVKSRPDIQKFSRNLILEIKYSKKFDSILRHYLKNLKFRVSKNSKYINSIVEIPTQLKILSKTKWNNISDYKVVFKKLTGENKFVKIKDKLIIEFKPIIIALVFIFVIAEIYNNFFNF